MKRTKFGKKKPVNKKVKSRREKTKYPALTKGMNLRNRMEQIDYDYIPMLIQQTKLPGPENAQKRKEAKEALKFLNDFTEGYINADHRSESVQKLFEGRDDIRKESYRRNNYRNQDLLTKEKSKGMTVSYEEYMSNLSKEEEMDLFSYELDNLENNEDESSGSS